MDFGSVDLNVRIDREGIQSLVITGIIVVVFAVLFSNFVKKIA